MMDPLKWDSSFFKVRPAVWVGNINSAKQLIGEQKVQAQNSARGRWSTGLEKLVLPCLEITYSKRGFEHGLDPKDMLDMPQNLHVL